MEIKLKLKDSKETATVRDEVQLAAFLKAGFEYASKAEEAKLKGEEDKE